MAGQAVQCMQPVCIVYVNHFGKLPKVQLARKWPSCHNGHQNRAFSHTVEVPVITGEEAKGPEG